MWNICGRIFSGICCYFGHFLEHSPENSRRLLLFWLFFGTFAGVFSPAFVATSTIFWNICRSFFSGICCCFGGFVEHLREFFLRHLRDDLLSRFERSARKQLGA